MSVPSMNGSLSPTTRDTSREDRKMKALHDGCCLIEKIMKEYEDAIRKKQKDSFNYIYPLLLFSLGTNPLPRTCNKSKHYAMYIFHKFYSHNDLEVYKYVDVAIACCYLVSKIQDSILTKVMKLSDFLVCTQNAWSKIQQRKYDSLIYIIPRLECILFDGIGFDLTFDIPHSYVMECFRMSMNMKANEVDALIVNAQKPSDSVRHFLHYCLFSQLCVDPNYDARALAAAAVDYAIGASQLKLYKTYNPNWLDRMNVSPSSKGKKPLSVSLIEAIQRERKRISIKMNMFNVPTKNISPIPPVDEHKRRVPSGSEEIRKRARTSSPDVDCVRPLSSMSSESIPPPIILPPSIEPNEPIIPTNNTNTYNTQEPAPLLSVMSEPVQSQLPPLIDVPQKLTVDSPAPLFPDQGEREEKEEAPLFSFN